MFFFAGNLELLLDSRINLHFKCVPERATSAMVWVYCGFAFSESSPVRSQAWTEQHGTDDRWFAPTLVLSMCGEQKRKLSFYRCSISISTKLIELERGETRLWESWQPFPLAFTALQSKNLSWSRVTFFRPKYLRKIRTSSSKIASQKHFKKGTKASEEHACEPSYFFSCRLFGGMDLCLLHAEYNLRRFIVKKICFLIWHVHWEVFRERWPNCCHVWRNVLRARPHLSWCTDNMWLFRHLSAFRIS